MYNIFCETRETFIFANLFCIKLRQYDINTYLLLGRIRQLSLGVSLHRLDRVFSQLSEK